MRTASSVAGNCPQCGVARPPLSNPAVIIELRKRVERMAQRKITRGWSLVIGSGTLLAIGIYLVVGRLGWFDITPHTSNASLRFQLVNPIFFPILFGVLVPLSLAFQRRQPEHREASSLSIDELFAELGITIES